MQRLSEVLELIEQIGGEARKGRFDQWVMVDDFPFSIFGFSMFFSLFFLLCPSACGLPGFTKLRGEPV